MSAQSEKITPQKKSALTRSRKKQAAFEIAEESAKTELANLGYGTRFYAGKCHAIEGLMPGDTYYQQQFPFGADSWQAALAAINE